MSASSDDEQPMSALRGALADLRRALDDLAQPPSSTSSPQRDASAVRTRLAALVQRLRDAGGPALSSLESINNERKERADKVARVVRKQVTGSGERSIRGFLRDELQQPPAVRAIDKIAFTASILSIMACEFVVLSYPSMVWALYVALIVPIIVLRFIYYRGKKWHYFLLDFCYFAQVLCLMQIFVFPSSCALQKANFAFANGPLSWAIPVWRNSLVFHSADKVVSCLVHILPSWLMYTLRWYGKSSIIQPAFPATISFPALKTFITSLVTPLPSPAPIAPSSCENYGVRDFTLAMALYLLWQCLYYLRTEVIDKEKLDANPDFQTSLRWMSADTKGALPKAVLALCRKMSIMGPDEEFDSGAAKTKVIFMSVQAVFTLATFLPVPLMYSSHTFSVVFLVGIFTCALANAGNYYIEVFSRRYYDNTMSGRRKFALSLGRNDDSGGIDEGKGSGSASANGRAGVLEAVDEGREVESETAEAADTGDKKDQ